jgi:hypothetical protein
MFLHISSKIRILTLFVKFDNFGGLVVFSIIHLYFDNSTRKNCKCIGNKY